MPNGQVKAENSLHSFTSNDKEKLNFLGHVFRHDEFILNIRKPLGKARRGRTKRKCLVMMGVGR